MQKQYPTPHINASPADFAKTVLMPGDPKRAAFIAKNFLDNARIVNDVRGVQGYTGSYCGVPVSVMASGMGMPSMAIYSYELYNFFGVQNIIRVGSAGALQEKLKIGDIVLAAGACTNSAYAASFGINGTFAPIADYSLLRACADTAQTNGTKVFIGNVLSSDTFYNDENDLPPTRRSNAIWAKMGVLAVEMETAALYMNAARAGKKALTVLTVSDSIVTGDSTDAAARETSFTDMMKLALDTAKAVD